MRTLKEPLKGLSGVMFWTQIKVSDDVVHTVPTHFVDKVVQPKLDDLKQISSGKLLPQNRQALESILDYLHSINPFVSFGFVKDNLEAVITKSDIASKNYFVSHISGNTLNNDVSINLNTPSTDTDLFETVVHEYVHTITNKLDLNDFFGLEQVQEGLKCGQMVEPAPPR